MNENGEWTCFVLRRRRAGLFCHGGIEIGGRPEITRYGSVEGWLGCSRPYSKIIP